MKELHFSKKYFKREIFDDPESKVRVLIKEKPCFEISEEEYSLRVSTRYENPETVHREWAVEHHLPPAKHSFPHLQFKFHTEGVGQFRLKMGSVKVLRGIPWSLMGDTQMINSMDYLLIHCLYLSWARTI
ncbi:hypothetical protein CMO89_03360 [Candidatus Woesearchaeota archaeon]|nr:hypothetical protein [Candidatus Woesearchaeota archaeon]|tara:strand:- start:7017 stop:7406 length:390 start_codon:yes stop_codon:yes gene_type:complete